jgi:hypothetical protein
MWQPHSDLGSIVDHLLDYIPQVLTEEPNNTFTHLCSFLPATEASVQFSAVLPMGGFANASSSHPIASCNNYSNLNYIIIIPSI